MGYDGEQAEEHFTTARNKPETMPHVVEVAHTRRLHGTRLHETASDERVRANALLNTGERDLPAAGHAQHAALCDDRLIGGGLDHA